MHMKTRLCVAMFALCGCAGAPALADDMFLRLEGIPGDSSDTQHPGEIALTSYSFGVEAESSWTKGGGASVGKPNPGELHFTALMNRSVAGVFNKIATGKSVPTATLTVRTALTGSRIGQEYVKYSFTGMFFTAVGQGLTGAGRAAVAISGVYKTLKIEQFGADGLPVACVLWDVPAGTADDCAPA
jgi:type VI secretion system secreted protein Hcp